MYVALYGQFIVNLCIMLYMIIQIYNNHKLNHRIRHVEKKHKEYEEDIRQYKKTITTLMAAFGRELDALEILEPKKKRGK